MIPSIRSMSSRKVSTSGPAELVDAAGHAAQGGARRDLGHVVDPDGLEGGGGAHHRQHGDRPAMAAKRLKNRSSAPNRTEGRRITAWGMWRATSASPAALERA
jgi:hypothetical protein